MNDPYRMVFISIISSLVVLSGLILYKLTYPKKKINLFVLLLIVSMLPLLSLFRPGTYESGDFNIHIYRIIDFFEALKEGILMPSWGSELNGTYGIPVFIFNYSLPYYFVSLFHFIGFSFVASMKIFLGATFFFSGIFMYLWIKELTGNKLAAFSSSIFYLFSPYHLIDVHFRATPGESLIFTLLPLLFLFIGKYFRRGRSVLLIFIALFTDLLFMSHPMLAAIFFGIAILYALLLGIIKKNIRTFLYILVFLTFGFFASIYVWAPFVIYQPYIFKIPLEDIGVFYPFNLLFYSPWVFGFLFQGHYGELAQIIGYTHIVILISSIFMLVKKKVSKKIRPTYIFWVTLCILILFLMHPLSNFIWQLFPNFASMMTPYGRLSLAISFCTAVIASYFVLTFSNSQTKKTIIYVILIITIGSTILNWGHRKVIPEIGDKYLQSHAWISVGLTPYFMNPRWAESPTFWFSKRPDASLEIIRGSAKVKFLKRSTIKHLYIIDAQTPITIRENTLYFPNWTLKSNNRHIPLYPGEKGIINANLPQGIHYVELVYEDLPQYKITKIISAGSLLVLLFLIPTLLIFRKKSQA